MSEAPHLDQGLALDAWFEVPAREAWEAEATRLLKGRPLAALTTSLPGIGPCPPLFTRADVDTTGLGIDEVVERIASMVESRLADRDATG